MSERAVQDLESRNLASKEFDVDTGTYMEDVHANDSIVGRDSDSDGLVDDVEKLIADADARAKAYNEEKERQEREHGKETKEKDSKNDYADYV